LEEKLEVSPDVLESVGEEYPGSKQKFPEIIAPSVSRTRTRFPVLRESDLVSPALLLERLVTETLGHCKPILILIK